MNPVQSPGQKPAAATLPAEQPISSNVPAQPENQPSAVMNEPITTFTAPEPQSVIDTPNPLTPKPKSKLKKLLIMLFVIVVFFMTSGVVLGAYAIAYEKIKLDKYPDFQKKVSQFVISLPFMPKTPKFLLAKSAYVHQSVKRESFDLSLAVDSQDLVSALGLSGLDIQAKGAVDYSDTKDIKVNVNASITKDFNVDVVKMDKILYFKIGKIPQVFLTALGFKSGDFDEVLNKWVAYDTSRLDTEARKSLEDKEVDPLSQQYVDEEFNKYLDEKVLDKMKIESAKEDGFDVYKITLNFDPELIDYLGKKFKEEENKNGGASMNVLGAKTEKLSDSVKSLTWQTNIDKKTYYTRKIVVNSELEVDSLNSSSLYMGNSSSLPQTSKVKLAFAAVFGDFGKALEAKTPDSSMTTEEFMNKISEVLQKKYGEMFNEIGSAQEGRAKDATRLSDLYMLKNSISLYKADNGKYPKTLNDLSKYIAKIPNDPDGSEYYYFVSADQKSSEVCVNLESPQSFTLNPCSNLTFNTGFKNP